MDRLRKAIIDAASEQLSMVDELTEIEDELIAAWNAIEGVTPITDKDIEATVE